MKKYFNVNKEAVKEDLGKVKGFNFKGKKLFIGIIIVVVLLAAVVKIANNKTIDAVKTLEFGDWDVEYQDMVNYNLKDVKWYMDGTDKVVAEGTLPSTQANIKIVVIYDEEEATGTFYCMYINGIKYDSDESYDIWCDMHHAVQNHSSLYY